jgi:NAD(P)H-dependent FMN reductase
MAKGVETALKSLGVETEWLDLRTLNLPLFDATAAYGHPSVQILNKALETADGIVVATPIYNYSVAAITKSCLEFSAAWRGKAVALLCAASTKISYMAAMPFLNSLMIDYRVFLLPRFVHASMECFQADAIVDQDIINRLKGLAEDFHQFVQALQPLSKVYVKA